MAHELTSGELYNFALSLRDKTLDEFKAKLLTTLKKPICSDDLAAGKKQELVTSVNVYVSNRTAHFLKRRTQNPLTYTAEMRDGKPCIVGTPALSSSQEDKYFSDLLKETLSAGPFDDLGEIGKTVQNAVNELAPELGIK